jgi:hypothetical protein
LKRRRKAIKDPSAKEHLREELAPKTRFESSPELMNLFLLFMMFEAEDLAREGEQELLPADEPTVIHWELNLCPGPDNNSENYEGKTRGNYC